MWARLNKFKIKNTLIEKLIEWRYDPRVNRLSDSREENTRKWLIFHISKIYKYPQIIIKITKTPLKLALLKSSLLQLPPTLIVLRLTLDSSLPPFFIFNLDLPDCSAFTFKLETFCNNQRNFWCPFGSRIAIHKPCDLWSMQRRVFISSALMGCFWFCNLV